MALKLKDKIIIGALFLSGIGFLGGSCGYTCFYVPNKVNTEYKELYLNNCKQTRKAIKNKDYDLAEELFKKRRNLMVKHDMSQCFWRFNLDKDIVDCIEESMKIEENLSVIKLTNEQ